MSTELLTEDEYTIVSRLEHIYLQRIILGIAAGNSYQIMLGRLQLKALDNKVKTIVSSRA